MKFTELVTTLRAVIGDDDGNRLAKKIVEAAGGETIYVPARPEAPEITARDTPATLMRRYRISRRTAYSWLQKWRS